MKLHTELQECKLLSLYTNAILLINRHRTASLYKAKLKFYNSRYKKASEKYHKDNDIALIEPLIVASKNLISFLREYQRDPGYKQAIIRMTAEVDELEMLLLCELNQPEPEENMDGHFWCVDENGTIHDIDFQHGTIHDIDLPPAVINKRYYLPASIESQTLVLDYMKEKHNWVDLTNFMFHPQFNYYNTLVIHRCNPGSTIVFGSLGIIFVKNQEKLIKWNFDRVIMKNHQKYVVQMPMASCKLPDDHVPHTIEMTSVIINSDCPDKCSCSH